MEALINKLVAEAGLTPAQAVQSVTIVKEFAKEKYPMFAGAIEQVFAGDKKDDDFMP